MRSKKKVFQSKILIHILIFSFILLTHLEVFPKKGGYYQEKEKTPKVKFREARVKHQSSQNDHFDKLIKTGLELYQKLRPEEAIKKFNDAKKIATSRLQKSDSFFYLSLVHFAINSGNETDEYMKKFIEVDYNRILDDLLCGPNYIEYFLNIKGQFGGIRIDSRPRGAFVYLNESNEPIGTTPLTIGSKSEYIKIKIKKGKEKKEDKLKINIGEIIKPPIYYLSGRSTLKFISKIGIGILALTPIVYYAFFRPEPKNGTLHVNSVPTGAKVYLDDIDMGKFTNCTLYDISPGTHTVKLIKEGWADYQESVNVKSKQNTTINAILNKHTITVIDPTRDTTWIIGEKVEIKWTYNGSLSSRSNIGGYTRLNSGLNLRGSILLPLNKRLFRSHPSIQYQKNRSEELRRRNSYKENKTILDKSVGSKRTSEQFSTLNKDRRIRQSRTNDIGGAKEIKSFNQNNFPASSKIPSISSRFSSQKFRLSGSARILTLTKVNIELYKGGSLVEPISSDTENDGLDEWPVSDSLKDGSDYKVRISCASDSGVYGESEEFRIEKKSGGKIVYSTSGTGWKIYIMDEDGSNPIQLTFGPGTDGDPVWSPDGRKIAFSSNRDAVNDSEIFVMNSDGSNLQKIASIPGDNCGNPDWSPNGTKIAFTLNMESNDNSIWWINADGTGLAPLYDVHTKIDFHSFSPDGNKIIFIEWRRLYIMNLDGTEKTQIGYAQRADWAPNPNQIVYVYQNGARNIYTVNPYTMQKYQLTYDAPSDELYLNPNWSIPNYEKIVFTKAGDVWIMNADGSDQTRLTFNSTSSEGSGELYRFN